MQQPGWANNNWGYDVLASPFAGGTMYLENNYAFLQQAGQWYLDSPTGQLFYKAAAGAEPEQPRHRTARRRRRSCKSAAATAARSAA